MGREHRRLDVRAFREASEKELMEKAKHYDEIYSDYYTKPSYASRKFRGDMDFDNITPAALQPTALDPKLWLIKCRVRFLFFFILFYSFYLFFSFLLFLLFIFFSFVLDRKKKKLNQNIILILILILILDGFRKSISIIIDEEIF